MPRGCECDKATCRPCWLWHNDARYHAHWGGPGLPTALTGAGWVAPPPVVTVAPAVPARFATLPACPMLGARVKGPCGVALHVCNLDGAKCARRGRCRDAVRECQTCTLRPDRTEVVPGLRDPLTGADVWPPTVEYRRSPESQARHLAGLREVLAWQPPTPATGTPSRGIVWVGGGKYWPGVVTGVRLLREVGCTLPVEVWHRGTCEPVRADQVAGLGVGVIDLDAASASRRDSRITPGEPERGGWEAKLYSLTRTRFDQVIYLDADAYCVRDPAPLFDLLTPSQPFAFWSDLPETESNVKWARVWPNGAAGVPTVQGGQLLVDRRHAARLLAVAHWMCQHSDFYFAHVYGDQDAWRVALAAGAGGYRHLGPAQWVGRAFVCGHGGTDYVVHRCKGKLFPGSNPEPCPRLPMEERVFELFREVIG